MKPYKAWGWWVMALIATPWLFIAAGIDAALHFFHFPHWCVFVRTFIGG